MALFSAGSSHTYHLAPFVLNVITTSFPCILPFVVFVKTLFSALYSSSCALPLSVLRSFPFPLTITFMQIDTQRFFSFHRLNFDWSILHLQNAFQQISSWMTAGLSWPSHQILSACRYTVSYRIVNQAVGHFLWTAQETELVKCKRCMRIIATSQHYKFCTKWFTFCYLRWPPCPSPLKVKGYCPLTPIVAPPMGLRCVAWMRRI